ncbi:MAG: SMEK domain-containing protein [Saprospiraceae bacterium]|nr:SMEK domain-containing protein [Saprospiraceae bacterium]
MSIVEFQHLNQQIKDKLFEMSYRVKCFNNSGDLDINRYAESYFKGIINILFKDEGWSFGKASKINQDTYDLFDNKNRICFQITSNIRPLKREKTIKQFTDKYNGVQFDKLKILFISDKKPKPSRSKYKIDYEDFNIIEFASLIESKCKNINLIEVRDILIPQSTIFTQSHKTVKKIELSEKEFKRCIKLEEELKKELLVKEHWKIKDLTKDPYKQFKSSRFIIRAYKDSEYPEVTETSKWNRTFMYDFYETGILIWPDATYGTKARINENGEWYIETFEDTKKPLENGYEVRNVRTICKLPYSHILHWKYGDDYYTDYHLYCKYEGIDETPFISVEYRYEDSAGYFWNTLDTTKNKRMANAKQSV